MHPTIVQDHPGDCPICGMKLVKLDAAAAGPAAGAAAAASAPARPQWQCPMHPSIVEDHPGDCPVCGMKLVEVQPKEPVVIADASPGGLAPVTIDAARQQLIGLRIAHVERGPVGGSWRTSGRVAIDETRIHHVNVKFSGFTERVYANFVGRPVKKGEPLYSIYSPELLAAQEEYLLALRTRETLARQGGGLADDGDALVKASRRKLELWDVPRSELARIERTGEASRVITFYSPVTGVVTKKDVVDGMRVNAGDMPIELVDLSRVWVLADAYETDLRKVKVGTAATLTLKAFPNREFEGRVAFIDPVLDPRTRTAKVRVEVPNPSGELKPDMFGEVVFRGAEREGLRVPPDAVIESGTQSVVFVALGEGRFQPREVKLGDRGPEYVEVVSGLQAGDGVVTRANFLVDSESRLRASLAALTSQTPTSQAPAPAPSPPPAAAPSGAGAGGAHAGH
jgi:Cu(I)/Ag(I) efflux system membrane fusion protein